MSEIFKTAIWFPFQKWGGSLIWFTPTVQDSCSWSLRQPTSNINRERCLIRKVFTRTVRLYPLNTSFLSRRYFSKCHNSFCFARLYILGSFSILSSYCITHPVFCPFLIFFLLHWVFYLNLDSFLLKPPAHRQKPWLEEERQASIVWLKNLSVMPYTCFHFYGHSWDLFWKHTWNSSAIITIKWKRIFVDFLVLFLQVHELSTAPEMIQPLMVSPATVCFSEWLVLIRGKKRLSTQNRGVGVMAET